MSLLGWLTSWFCGTVFPGHSYTMQMIGDGESYVLDPFATCAHCGLALPEEILVAITKRIREASRD